LVQKSFININTVIFIANRGFALSRSRKGILKRFLSNGWTVVVATSDDVDSRRLKKLGINLEIILFRRGSFSFRHDYKTIIRLKYILQKWRPTFVMHFHAKPVIFGTVLAKLFLGNSVRIVNTITGLGNSFAYSFFGLNISNIVFRLASNLATKTIFQNKDDKTLFLKNNIIPPSKAKLIVSSGVDITHFEYIDRKYRNNNNVVVLIISRLLKQKGILEFIEVAKKTLKQGSDARFIIIGEEFVGHPDAISVEMLRNHNSIQFLGKIKDVKKYIAKADIFLFPSYYREGVPRVILEASAMGLPTVAFDVPGVREAIIDGKTGYLVKKHSTNDLVKKVSHLLENFDFRLNMGLRGRELMVRKFAIQDIEDKYIQVYRDLGIKID
jgi:glycosyltransferase involved in cell wall biosynthesis